MLIRRSHPDDREALRRVHRLAFAGEAGETPAEVGLLDRLLDDGDVIGPLSLVALVDGEIAGHVTCSRARVGTVAVAGLGPIGVLPAVQGRGVGTALMHAVLGAADALELPLVGLLGAPELYGRFGFVAAAEVGVEAPDPRWGLHFQVRTLSAYDPGVRGPFRYAPAFDAV